MQLDLLILQYQINYAAEIGYYQLTDEWLSMK